MDIIENNIVNELDRLEHIYRHAEPGSNEEYYYKAAYDMMCEMLDKIGRKMFDDEATETLNIISESINNVINNK